MNSICLLNIVSKLQPSNINHSWFIDVERHAPFGQNWPSGDGLSMGNPIGMEWNWFGTKTWTMHKLFIFSLWFTLKHRNITATVYLFYRGTHLELYFDRRGITCLVLWTFSLGHTSSMKIHFSKHFQHCISFMCGFDTFIWNTNFVLKVPYSTLNMILFSLWFSFCLVIFE